jgi:ABC-type phosphate transport system substrate-binding protein
MPNMTLKAKVGRVAFAGALLGVGATSFVAQGGPAAADPPQYTALVGVGSDTTQDVLNALSGYNQGTVYTPVFSDTGTPRATIVSLDAVPPAGVTDGCVTTKFKGPTYARPNGSGSGQKALSRAIDGGVFGPNPTAITAQQCAEPGKAISNQVDFARSSSGPSGGAGTVLTFIPFARDALTFGYYRAGGAPVTDLTTAQLQQIYTNADPVNNPTVIGGVPIIPCGIQTSSGTYGTWNTDLGITAAQEDAATAACRGLTTATSDAATGRVQENYGVGLTDKGNAVPATGPLAGAQVIVGFSASNFIAQSNGKVTNQLSSAQLGSIGGQAPTTGAAPALAPNGTFYASTTYGRDVYNVLPQSKLTGAGNLPMKEIFVATGATAPGAGQPGRGLPANFTPVLCRTGAGSAQATVNQFGFLSISNCGSTTSTAGSRSGAF